MKRVIAAILVELTILDGDASDLVKSLTGEGREFLTEVMPTLNNGSYTRTWAGVFGEPIEWQTSNGWRSLRADEVGARTHDYASTILSDDVDDDDQGHVRHVDSVSQYPHYETQDQLEELLAHGTIRLQRVPAEA